MARPRAPPYNPSSRPILAVGQAHITIDERRQTNNCARSYQPFAGPEGDGQPVSDPFQVVTTSSKAREHDMNQHLLMHTVMRYQNPDSPELARRRENLTLFERAAREVRRRRRSEFTNRLLNALSAFRRADTDEQMRRCGEALL